MRLCGIWPTKVCEEYEKRMWRERAQKNSNPYFEGLSDGAGECVELIRAGEK